MTFGERLRELRKENGMTLDEVAEQVGLAKATIYRYETGTIKKIPAENYHLLANLFGVSRPYIMGWTDERHDDPDQNLDIVAEKLRETDREAGRRWKPASGSDCMTAANQALRTLVKFKIARTPIYPQQILQASSKVTMMTYDGLNGSLPIEFHTVVRRKDGNPHYLFNVDRNAPIGYLSLSLATEIGHIYLSHDEGKMDDAMEREAECFAIHLRFPRPVIRLLQERGFVFTEETFAKVFGYCDWCLDSILNAPRVVVSPELNRLVKEQFMPYVRELEEVSGLWRFQTGEKELDLTRYMDGYEE